MMNIDILGTSYDIRGIYGQDIDSTFFFQLGRCIAETLSGNKIAVGMDARTSGPELKKSLIDGILASGKDVVDIGMCSTDMVYFATSHYPDIDGGVMVTASHNPKEYNGAKICHKYSVPLNTKLVGAEWKQKMIENDFITPVTAGMYTQKDILADWIDHIVSFVDDDVFKNTPVKIVADAGNGVAGIFMDALQKRLGFELIPMFFDPDGDFPNHQPSPIEPENVEAMQKMVKQTGADMGVAFDGDADRMYICDENGVMFSGSVTTAIIAKHILKNNPGATILHNAICGDIVPETIRSNGGTVIRSKVGHVYIKEMMAENTNILFGGEHSGHYFFRKNDNADSGVIAFLIVAEMILRSKQKASVLRAAFDTYFQTPETNFRVADVQKTIQAVVAHFPDALVDTLDGTTIRGKDFWFNLRPSSNEPLLRLNIETRRAVSKYILLTQIRTLIASLNITTKITFTELPAKIPTSTK